MSVIGFPVSIENAHCGYMLYVSASNVGKKSMSELRSSYLQELTQNYKRSFAKRRAEILEAKRKAGKEKQEVVVSKVKDPISLFDIKQEEQSKPTHDFIELPKSEATSYNKPEEVSWDYFDGFDTDFSEEDAEDEDTDYTPEEYDDGPAMESASSLDFLNLVAAKKQSSVEYESSGKLITDCPIIEKASPVTKPVVSGEMYVTAGKSIFDCAVIENRSPVQKAVTSKPTTDVEYVSSGKLITSCDVLQKHDEPLIEEVPEEAIEIRPVVKTSSTISKQSTDSKRPSTTQATDMAAIRVEGEKHKLMPQSKPAVKTEYEFSELTEKNVKDFVRKNKGCYMIDIIHAFGNFPEAKVKETILGAKRHNKIQVKHDQYYL